MARTCQVMIGMGSVNSIATSTTKPFQWGFGSPNVTDNTEATCQVKSRATITAEKTGCYVTSNGVSAASTFTSRKNAGAGNVTITVTASTNGLFQDTVNSDSVVATDLMNYSITTGGTGTTLNFNRIQANYKTTTQPTAPYVSEAWTTSAGATTWSGVGGSNGAHTSEITQVVCKSTTATVNFAFGNVTNNLATTATLLKVRKNLADGNGVVSCTALTNGYFEDTTNSDSLVTDDDVGLQFTGGATSVCVFGIFGYWWLSTDHKMTGSWSTDNGIAVTDATTRYGSFGGDGVFNTAEDIKAQNSINILTIDNMFARCSTNPVAANKTMLSRNNLAPGNMTVTVTASTTGLFEDNVNSDVVAASDESGYSYAGGAGATQRFPNMGARVLSGAAGAGIQGWGTIA